MHATESGVRGRSVVATVLLLLGLALVVRVGVVGLATGFGPTDSVGDVRYHAELVDDPIGHLHRASRDADVAQYAPYLGVVEWVTARPWLAVGFSPTTALRLSSITWDLIGMALLLAAAVKRFPGRVVFVGLMWALSPLMWPASAYSAQDEPITAAVVSLVVLLSFLRRRTAAIVACVLGLFVVKILLLPVLAALLLTTPAGRRVRAAVAAGATAVIAVGVTWLISGTDGLSQQASYSTDVLGFSMSFWSTLVLHQAIGPETAIHVSIAFVAVGLVVITALWWRDRRDDVLDFPRLAAGLLFVAFALLGISNPEYLCIAAPVAIVACIGLGAVYQSWALVAVSSAAWAINGVYYLMRRAYDPTGSLLGIDGFDHPVSRKVHLYDVTHQVLLAAFLIGALVLARNYAVKPRPVDNEVEPAAA